MKWTRLAASLITFGIAAATLGGCSIIIDNRAGQREAEAEAQYPPTGQFIEVDGRRVHAHVEGSGPDLVLIHGASGNTRDFTFDLVARLAGDYRVIVFDRPGLGWSDPLPGSAAESPIAQADALRAAAAALGVRRPVILGHSYGGAVALAWALRAPSEPAALVVLAGATHPWPGELGPWYRVASSPVGQRAVIPLLTALAPMSQADTVIGQIFAPQDPPEGYGEHIGAGLTLRRDTLRINTRQVNRLKPYLERMAPLYAQLTLPVEVVHGSEDRVVWLDIHGRALADEMPNARLTVLEGVGHMPHHAAPEAVVQAIHRAAARAGLR